jgi:sigma-B regulation protein RsbU (phosphoserine phosphatase)
LRTYSREYPQQPDQVFNMFNQRMLADTDGNQFVSVFYGVLDPLTGEMVYSNAGHCLPIWGKVGGADSTDGFKTTGTVLGLFEAENWRSEMVVLNPGDVIVLYTDGITEAQNQTGVFFERQRLRQAVQERHGDSAGKICAGILSDVEAHMDGADQFDDIALVVIERDGG